MNHRKCAECCSFCRDDACAQQAGGTASLRVKEELRRYLSYSTDLEALFSEIYTPMIPSLFRGDTD